MIVTARLRATPFTESDLSLLVALHLDERILSEFGAEPATAPRGLSAQPWAPGDREPALLRPATLPG